jgi:hypothetical protein
MSTSDLVKRQQLEDTIAKHKLKHDMMEGGHGKGSSRFTVKHTPEDSYDHHRNASFAPVIKILFKNTVYADYS